jgi:hypothetical protein
MIYDIKNPGPRLGQAQKCGRDKQVNEILTTCLYPEKYK